MININFITFENTPMGSLLLKPYNTNFECKLNKAFPNFRLEQIGHLHNLTTYSYCYMCITYIYDMVL